MTMVRALGCMLLIGCAKAGPPSVVNPPVEPVSMAMPEVQTAEPSQGPDRTIGDRCDQEAARDCAEGMVDGCSDGRTTHHVCVAATAVVGAPCAEASAKDCPPGQVDACLQQPALADTHLCVVPLTD